MGKFKRMKRQSSLLLTGSQYVLYLVMAGGTVLSILLILSLTNVIDGFETIHQRVVIDDNFKYTLPPESIEAIGQSNEPFRSANLFVEGNLMADLNYTNSSMVPEWQLLSLILLYFLLLIYSCWQLIKFIQSLKQGSPFTQANVNRLKYFSLLAIFLGLFQHALKFIGRAIMKDHFVLADSIDPFRLSIGLHWFNTELVVGIALWILVMVFQRGLDLEKENALTV